MRRLRQWTNNEFGAFLTILLKSKGKVGKDYRDQPFKETGEKQTA